MSHLAGIIREATATLDDRVGEVTSFARTPPGWLSRLCALTGGLSLTIGRGYGQRADLTSRFIKKATTGPITWTQRE